MHTHTPTQTYATQLTHVNERTERSTDIGMHTSIHTRARTRTHSQSCKITVLFLLLKY